MNAVTEFAVGDTVTHSNGGEGTVVAVDERFNYPVQVEWAAGGRNYYLADGFFVEGGETKISHVQTDEPKQSEQFVGDSGWRA